ncbi:MAG: hypothetical protein HQL06_16340 [Nitrospirae bacterium]|nr:hypothetical protein [Nitrospirota bacterium]
MKVLLILKQEPDPTGITIIKNMREHSEFSAIDLRTNKDYDAIIDSVVASDKVITW